MLLGAIPIDKGASFMNVCMNVCIFGQLATASSCPQGGALPSLMPRPGTSQGLVPDQCQAETLLIKQT